MHPGENKEVVGRYFLQGLGELNPDVVDEVFAPDHVLGSPELGTETVTGTQMIKDLIEEFRSDAGGLTCNIESQIEEGDWVATRYTLREEQDDHMGIMFSRVDDGKIQESYVVAKTVSGTLEEGLMAATRPTTLRQAFN
jgi:hypothetical protein